MSIACFRSAMYRPNIWPTQWTKGWKTPSQRMEPVEVHTDTADVQGTIGGVLQLWQPRTLAEGLEVALTGVPTQSDYASTPLWSAFSSSCQDTSESRNILKEAAKRQHLGSP